MRSISEHFAQLLEDIDTDTNASLAGQVVGPLLGPQLLPAALLQQLAWVPSHSTIHGAGGAELNT